MAKKLKSNTPRIITTGGVGHIPPNYGLGGIDYIRRKLYDNIIPFGYNNPVQRVYNAVIKDRREEYDPEYRVSDDTAETLDALWGQYLAIPENQRHAINNNNGIVRSAGPDNKEYYQLKNLDPIIDEVIDTGLGYTERIQKVPGVSPWVTYHLNPIKLGETVSSNTQNQVLGDYQIGRGYDDRGEYLSYQDVWDINPYQKTVNLYGLEKLENESFFSKLARLVAPKEGDASFGIGNPVNIYGKVYLDDIYGVSTPTHSTYLPEVTVYGNKKATGGELSKPLEWNELSMRDRAAYIRKAVSRGINTPLDIRNDYNEFKGGGKKNSGNLKKVFLNSLLLSLNGYSRYNTPLWRKFLTDLALLESSYNANALNSIGAKGYFQLMPSNRSATWSNPVLLFHEMYKLSDSNMEYFRKNLTKDDIKKAESMGIDIYGLMAGAHLGGVGNAIKAIRGQGNAKDMNNSSVLGYMKKFSQTSNNTPVLTDSKVMKMPPFEYPLKVPVAPVQEPIVFPELLTVPESIATEPIVLLEPSMLGIAPEVVITPEPRYLDDTDDILSRMQSLITPYLAIELPKPTTATERLALIADNRNTLLLKDLENNIIRNSLLGTYDNDKLRRDVEDLQFYRNMSALGGNLYSGKENHSQQMQLGLDVQGWPNYTTELIIAYGDENERRRKALENTYLNFVTESNDATAVANGRPQNQHLADKAIQGAKAHAAWEKEHPNLTAWSYLPSAAVIGTALAPLGAAGWAGVQALGDAAAATSVGQGITNFLAPIATTSYAGATVPQWFDLGLTSGFGAHGIQTAIDEGGVSPMTALETTPLGRVAKPMLNAGKEAVYNIADRYIFMPHQNSFTRGIGMTDAGLLDAVTTGVFRGNPRGTEQTAKVFDKMFLKNRNHFRDIVKDTGIPGIESRYQSRTLTKEDFNALKKASEKYESLEGGNTVGKITLKQSIDPLENYATYEDYIKAVTSDIAKTEQMPSRIASGEIVPNTELSEPMWFEDESGRMLLPQGKPFLERFGPNSDYLADGTPLSYWYADGRNPITQGHAYAKSNYGVRVNNPEDYQPFMHEMHLHPSFFRSPKFTDPNVEIFGKGPLGLTVKLDKETLLPVWKRDLSNMFRREETIRTPQITAENAVSPHVGIDYSDFSSTVNPTSIFEKLTYQNRINGFPNLSFSGKDDAGNIIFSPDVIKGLSSEAKDNLMYNTVGRNIREFKQAGYDDIMNNIYKEKAEQLFDDVNVGRYSGKDYTRAGEENSGGFFNQDRNFISINKDSGFPETFVEEHEGRHLLDYNSSLLDSQYKILGDAYDSDFINIPNTEYAGYLKDYKFMGKERVTTNRDARDTLFEKFGKHFKYADYNLQDKFIDKLPDDAIFEAVEKANGYGKRFIQFLRDNGKLTPEKAQQFREAMKHVGAIAAPIGLTGYGVFNNQLAYGGNLFPKGGPMINVNPGDRVFTDLCALWSNSLLRDNGYLINGNAWNLGNVDLLYNGFEGLDRPENYDSRVVADYNHKAADNVFKNFDSKTLDTSKPYVVNMYYNNSPSLEEAYNNGKGVAGTHTGVLTFDPDTKRWLVTHNIHGNIHLEPFVSLLNGKGKYGVTAIYAPREKNMWNRVKGFFGFDNGGYINKV